jgi:membrane-bound ClpP family serine protease
MDTWLAWGLGLFALSFILLLIELFVPTAGIMGVIACVAAIGGVVCMTRYDSTWGAASALATMVLGPMAAYFMLKVWPSTPLGRKIFATPTEEELAQARQAEEGERKARLALIGKEGKALTDLRPVGLIDLNGVRMEVLAEVGFIPAGTRVRVSHADLSQVKVRAAT